MMHFFKLFVLGLALVGSSGVMAQQANTQPVNNEQTPPVIKAKTDEQIEYEQDYIPANWREMSQKEREEFAKKILEDRFILTTMNFKVITSGQTKICTLNVILNNNSPRTIKNIRVNYSWDETSTFATFKNVAPQTPSVGVLSLSGDVCSRVTKGADYKITTCEVDGLTTEQCKMRVYPIK